MVLRQSQMQPAPLLDTLLSWQIRGARSIAPLLPWHSLPAGARRSRPLCIHHAATHRPVSGAHTGEEELKWPGTSAPPSHAPALLIVLSTDRRHDLNETSFAGTCMLAAAQQPRPATDCAHGGGRPAAEHAGGSSPLWPAARHSGLLHPQLQPAQVGPTSNGT